MWIAESLAERVRLGTLDRLAKLISGPEFAIVNAAMQDAIKTAAEELHGAFAADSAVDPQSVALVASWLAEGEARP